MEATIQIVAMAQTIKKLKDSHVDQEQVKEEVMKLMKLRLKPVANDVSGLLIQQNDFQFIPGTTLEMSKIVPGKFRIDFGERCYYIIEASKQKLILFNNNTVCDCRLTHLKTFKLSQSNYFHAAVDAATRFNFFDFDKTLHVEEVLLDKELQTFEVLFARFQEICLAFTKTVIYSAAIMQTLPEKKVLKHIIDGSYMDFKKIEIFRNLCFLMREFEFLTDAILQIECSMCCDKGRIIELQPNKLEHGLIWVPVDCF